MQCYVNVKQVTSVSLFIYDLTPYQQQ